MELAKKTSKPMSSSVEPTEREIILANELEKTTIEINRLVNENKALQQDRDAILSNYENVLRGSMVSSPQKNEYEKRIRVLEDDRVNSNVQKMSLETQIEELKRHLRDREAINYQMEKLIQDKNYFEAEAQKAKVKQQELEKDLRNRDHDYQTQIAQLLTENSLLKTRPHIEASQTTLALSKLQDDNSVLIGEVATLKGQKRVLEESLERLKNERVGNEEALRTRMVEIEANARNLANLYDQERRAADSYRQLAQTRGDELKSKEIGMK
jgi:hypothetical protein